MNIISNLSLSLSANSGFAAKKQVKIPSQTNAGRSMIEMLGVLAIIGVLSVGGLAGYSKAMQKFKINKMIDEYNNVAFSLVENYQNLLKSYGTVTEKNTELYTEASDLRWIPDTWKPLLNRGFVYLDDGHGNLTHLYMRYDSSTKKRHVIMDIYLGKTMNNFNAVSEFPLDTCLAFFSDWLKPISGVLSYAGVYSTNYSSAKSNYFYGNTNCGGDRKCLDTMTLNDIHNMCKTCQDDRKECYIAVNFLEY